MLLFICGVQFMRTILHSDINHCYAAIECLHHPELRDKAVAVAGDPEQRHGIILAKNIPAKKCGVKTGEAIWQARQKCPSLVVLPPNFPLYLRFCRYVKDIYCDYTRQIESFGIDESWLDVSGSRFGSGEDIAKAIMKRVKNELGITVSIGVADNKIFAKLGSDMKKPDGLTVINHENYKDKVWPLPASDLLYVGPATNNKLRRYGIETIGQIAQSEQLFLKSFLGKWGSMLWRFANGLDSDPVADVDDSSVIKSIGNSTTSPRDLETNEDVSLVFHVLCESVAMRLREQGFMCRGVQIHLRTCELHTFERQKKLTLPTCLSTELHDAAMELFLKNYDWQVPLRSIGVRAADLTAAGSSVQLSMFVDENRRIRRQSLEKTVDQLRGRFGNFSVRRAVTLTDPVLSGINPKDEHVIFPVGYVKKSIE